MLTTHWQRLGSARWVFALVFLYALGVGIALQTLVLPVLLPQLHAGHGLLKGHDWVWFHEEAARLAERIGEEGWAAWSLRPQGNAPIGIAAAAYALTGVHEPWVLLPLNAALFALGATMLFSIFRLLAPPRQAALAVSPFVLFPSAAMIYAQIHKDVWAIAGVLAVLFVWAWLSARMRPRVWRGIGMVAVTALGATLAWVVRAYLVVVLWGVALPVASALAVVGVWRARYGRGHGPSAAWWTAMGLSLAVLYGFTRLAGGVPFAPPGPGAAEVATGFPGPAQVSGAGSPGATAAPPPVAIGSGTPSPSAPSPQSTAPLGPMCRAGSWAEKLLRPARDLEDRLLRALAEARRRWAQGYPEAGSNVDVEVSFRSTGDVVAYLPRALQIGLLAPFPNMWFARGKMPGGSITRPLAGLETLVAYLLLPGLALLLARGSSNAVTVMAVLVLCTGALAIHGLVVTNVGAIYRLRYGFWQTLVGLGLLGWLRFWPSASGGFAQGWRTFRVAQAAPPDGASHAQPWAHGLGDEDSPLVRDEPR
jgi:hypothetical protein